MSPPTRLLFLVLASCLLSLALGYLLANGPIVREASASTGEGIQTIARPSKKRDREREHVVHERASRPRTRSPAAKTANVDVAGLLERGLSP